MSAIDNYYDTFKEYLLAVGWHQSIVKLGFNADDGIYPAKKVAKEYGYEGARRHKKTIERDDYRWEKLNHLDYWSQRVGFKPIREADKDRIMKFMEDVDRRRYIRQNVKRAAERGELLSIADFISKRLELEKKRNEKVKASEAET